MNIFIKSLKPTGKIIVLFILAYLFLKLIFAENPTQTGIGLFVLIFITLPTLFIFFFKQNILASNPKLIKPWKIYLIFYCFFIILFVFLYALGTWHLNEVAKTKKAIDFINSQKITMDDVMGKNLPPQPDQKINDSTIAGIDVNKNVIRDDVELAIFKEYPDSAKIRAAELQYALELENELINIFNSDTWVAVMKDENNGISCLADLSFSEYKDIRNQINKSNDWKTKVADLVFNTDIRKQKKDAVNVYESAYVVGDGKCDIDILSLSN